MNDLVEIVLDIETTGLNIKEGHRIIEVGCIELRNRKLTGREFHVYINPQRKIDQEAIKVHGIQDDFLISKPIFVEIAKALREFIGGAKVVAHNGLGFDIKFLNSEFIKCGLNEIVLDKVVDTLIIAKKKFPGSPASLDALCKRFNINLSKRKLHGALIDAKLLANVYTYLQGNIQQKIFLEPLDKKHYDNKELVEESYNTRLFHLSDSDMKLHSIMLEKIKNPLWLSQHNSDK